MAIRVLDDGVSEAIVWRTWTETTAAELGALGRPILVVVRPDEAPKNLQSALVAPFIREWLVAAEKNAGLKAELEFFPPLLLEGNAIPAGLEVWGIGESIHLAILSPHGLNPMATFDVTSLVGATGIDTTPVARALAVLRGAYGAPATPAAPKPPASKWDVIIGGLIWTVLIAIVAIWRCG